MKTALLLFLILILVTLGVRLHMQQKAVDAPRNYPAGFIGPVRLQDTIDGKPAYEYKDGQWISTPR